MFGEAFAAELNPEEGEEPASFEDEAVVPLKMLGPKWMVGGGEDFVDIEFKESEDDAIFSKYVFSAVKGNF